VVVGEKLYLTWPKKDPQMRICGVVTAVTQTAFGTDVTVQYGSGKSHKVLLEGAKVNSASKGAEMGFWLKDPTR